MNCQLMMRDQFAAVVLGGDGHDDQGGIFGLPSCVLIDNAECRSEGATTKDRQRRVMVCSSQRYEISIVQQELQKGSLAHVFDKWCEEDIAEFKRTRENASSEYFVLINQKDKGSQRSKQCNSTLQRVSAATIALVGCTAVALMANQKGVCCVMDAEDDVDITDIVCRIANSLSERTGLGQLGKRARTGER